ncbi:hypothetical protein [Bradyrhizobium prioriisuperbiae]|uniref:hypothetical protein n=1 Tax=Bradyrhizobium prioriisuperbiae TaxID=2854389 RepID=UPI0028E20F2A|nr:hypothetical protein [Bradyrhizobium prioritasuperba]
MAKWGSADVFAVGSVFSALIEVFKAFEDRCLVGRRFLRHGFLCGLDKLRRHFLKFSFPFQHCRLAVGREVLCHHVLDIGAYGQAHWASPKTNLVFGVFLRDFAQNVERLFDGLQ